MGRDFAFYGVSSALLVSLVDAVALDAGTRIFAWTNYSEPSVLDLYRCLTADLLPQPTEVREGRCCWRAMRSRMIRQTVARPRGNVRAQAFNT
jgi:hypothetical protein